MSKNILILGAAGQISQMLISNLLENTDFNLKLYGRNLSKRIRVTDVSRETVIDGDFSDKAKLVQAMKDVDVVYLNSMESVADTQTIVVAMNEAGVKRIIGATIVGIYDEFDGPLKEWTNANLSESYRIDERKSAQLVENSNLDYTLVRLTWLFNDESHLDYVLLEKGEEVKQNFDVNVFGLMQVTQMVMPYMRQKQSGHIINLASISGTVTGPSQSIYSATKAAVIMMGEALADEVAAFGIKVTSIAPSGVRTDFLDQSSMKTPAKKIADYDIVKQTMKGLANFNHNQSGDPDLVAKAILEVAKMEQAPRRLYLGKPAIMASQSQIGRIVDETNQHLDLSNSIDTL